MPKFLQSIDHNGKRGLNGGDATAPTDFTTLQQVQALVRGLSDWKDDVRATTTGNIVLSGTQSSDGVALVAGDSVLVRAQTNAAENGPYVVAAGAWSRRSDADSSAEVSRGMTVTVLEGTTKGTGAAAPMPITYTLTTSGAIVLGTTPLSFSTVGGTAGGPAVTEGTGIDVSGGVVSIEPGFRARSFAASCVATTNPQTFAHGLGTADYVFVVREGAVQVFPDVTADATSLVVDWGGAPTAGQYRVTAVAVV